MRFCPFCSAENATIATHCGTCARRLPPLPPRRRTSADDTASDAATRVSAPPTEATASADEPSLLARVAMSPAARRRTRPPEPAADPDGPGRRKTDGEFRGLRGPLEDGRGAPPAPSRAERDRVATARASREIPITRGDQTAAESARRRSATPVPIPRPSTPAAPAEEPADDAQTALTRAAPPREFDTVPVAEDSEEGWPAPARPPAEPDPDDWSEDAQVVLQEVRKSPTPPPTPPPRNRVDSSRLTPPPRQSSPPPTRIGKLSTHEVFKPPSVNPIPEVPERGLVNAARYALSFARAHWQRRSVIKQLAGEITSETTDLDQVLGALGAEARATGVDNRVLAAENAAIDEAEARRQRFEHESAELGTKQAEENNKFHEVERERETKVDEASAALDKGQRELGSLEAQRRSLREKRKTVERQQRAYLKTAEEREDQASKSTMGDSRAGLRRAAEDLRRDAAALDPERQDLDRRLAALEKPISKAAARVEALKAELESAHRSLNDAREGHRHRLAELEAEQGRKSRELALADGEIQRRLVTLGTLVNLHRIERPEFDDMYARIDSLRSAIGARSTEIDRLTAEREAYDKASLVRGFLVLGGGVVAILTLIVILLAIW